MLNLAAISSWSFPLSAILDSLFCYTVPHHRHAVLSQRMLCLWSLSLFLIRTFMMGLTHTSDTPLFWTMQKSGAWRTWGGLIKCSRIFWVLLCAVKEGECTDALVGFKIQDLTHPHLSFHIKKKRYWKEGSAECLRQWSSKSSLVPGIMSSLM